MLFDLIIYEDRENKVFVSSVVFFQKQKNTVISDQIPFCGKNPKLRRCKIVNCGRSLRLILWKTMFSIF